MHWSAFYVQNINMCIHSQGVGIPTFFQYKYFFEAILLVLIRFMLRFKMGTVSDLSLKLQDLQGPGGIMCDHLFIFIYLFIYCITNIRKYLTYIFKPSKLFNSVIVRQRNKALPNRDNCS